MILNPSYNTVLSEQFLVDCDTRDYGCNGGWPHNAASMYKEHFMIMSTQYKRFTSCSRLDFYSS